MTAHSAENGFEQEAKREALLVLYKNTPAVSVVHIVAAGAVVYAFSLVIALQTLLVWWTGLSIAAIARVVVSMKFMARWPIDDAALPAWIRTQSLLAFILTAFWGSTVFIIWPDSGEYRTLLIAVLIGIVSAGGVVLATHMRSFLLYCGPILIPLVYQLLQEGGRLQETLAGMIVLYVVVLLIAISRLERTFIDGVKLRLQMHALSKTDVLTGIANRRGFDDYLNDAWQNATRSSQPIGLIMADVDFFKDYNDQYGHPAGDEALTRVAEFLRSVASRGTDLCARVGGEEFAVVMSATDLEGSIRIAEDIQSAMYAAAIEHKASPNEKLTISMGVSSRVPGREDSIHEFLEMADKALYEAKSKGRNRIEVSKPG